MNLINKILPITSWLPNYERGSLKGDVFAGLTVGIMLIPQGMAYALIAGLPPVYGLYASIIPSIIYALFGTSRQLSVAPVAMDSLLVATGVSVIAAEGTQAYLEYAILLAFMVGVLQLLLGIFRLGFITNLLSKPVISGFTSAAALIIGLNQLKYLLGVELEKSNKVYEILWSTIQQIGSTHWITLLIGLGGILLIKGVKKIYKSIPGALMAVIFGTSLVYFLRLDLSGVAIVKDIPEGLPAFIIPSITIDKISTLAPLAVTIAVVAYMEAFSVAKAIEAKKRDYKVMPNQELVAIGFSNFIGSFFQAFPVTGGFSRTAVNYQSGANTSLSSIISAGVVALTLIFLTPLFYYLPKAILASVIMVAVAGLVDYRYVVKLWEENRLEFAVLVITFLVTLNVGMVIGIVTGIILSILMLLFRAAYPHIAQLGRVRGHHEFRNIKRFPNLQVWENILIFRMDAPLTFINVQYFIDYIEEAISEKPKVDTLIMDFRPINHIDATAAQGVNDLLDYLNEKNIKLLLCDIVGPVRDSLYKTNLIDKIGKSNIFLDLNEAVYYCTTEDAGDHKAYALQSNVEVMG